MFVVDLGSVYAQDREECADTLREIANRIEEGYYSGITNNGTDWSIEEDIEE
jgi:hypothetical protein